jgi:hypothetical protein
MLFRVLSGAASVATLVAFRQYLRDMRSIREAFDRGGGIR